MARPDGDRRTCRDPARQGATRRAIFAGNMVTVVGCSPVSPSGKPVCAAKRSIRGSPATRASDHRLGAIDVQHKHDVIDAGRLGSLCDLLGQATEGRQSSRWRSPRNQRQSTSRGATVRTLDPTRRIPIRCQWTIDRKPRAVMLMYILGQYRRWKGRPCPRTPFSR